MTSVAALPPSPPPVLNVPVISAPVATQPVPPTAVTAAPVVDSEPANTNTPPSVTYTALANESASNIRGTTVNATV